jgi:hypothetical protein
LPSCLPDYEEIRGGFAAASFMTLAGDRRVRLSEEDKKENSRLPKTGPG